MLKKITLYGIIASFLHSPQVQDSTQFLSSTKRSRFHTAGPNASTYLNLCYKIKAFFQIVALDTVMIIRQLNDKIMILRDTTEPGTFRVSYG